MFGFSLIFQSKYFLQGSTSRVCVGSEAEAYHPHHLPHRLQGHHHYVHVGHHTLREATTNNCQKYPDAHRLRQIYGLTTSFTILQDPVINVEKKKLFFKGVGGTEMKEHEVTMEFFKEIDPDKSKFAVRPREVQCGPKKTHEPCNFNISGVICAGEG